MGTFKILAIGITLLAVVSADPILKSESIGSEKMLTREKRQIPVQTLPTFPPDVERTADGVPILDESYLDRADRPAARFFAQFEPTTESEGLRLYEGLWATGGRNEPRSLDHSDPFGDNGIQPHHRQSAAWSTKKETKRFSSSRSGRKIQVRSGGSDQEDLPVALLPSGFGPSTGPKFSEEVTYRRSGGNSNSGNLQTRSLTSTHNGENGFTCVTCRRSSSTAGAGASTGSSHQLRSLGHASEELSGGHAETEGLRLYNKWLSESQSRHGQGGLTSRRNRNQLRSLDNGASAAGNFLDETTDVNGNSRHSASSSWTKREERRHSSRRSSKTITVRSGGAGTSDLPAPVLPSVTVDSTPKFSEEVTYRRNAGGSSNSGNSGTQTRSLISTSRRNNNNNGESGFSCVTCRRSSVPNLASTATGSRNEVRSLDLEQTATVGQHATLPALSPNVQTHHSESWSENEERRHHNSRSSSSSSVPVNGGEVRVTDLENRADIIPTDQSEEVVYRRASSGSNGSGGCAISNGASSHSSTSSSAATNNGSYRRTNCTRIASGSRTNGQSSAATTTETRSLSSASNASGNGASSSGCRRCVTQTSSSLRSSDNEGSLASAAYRSSRVPSTTSSRATTRALDYPPVQTFGQGDGAVAARVLHSDDDSELSHHQTSSASENGAENSEAASSASSGKKIKKAYYRRTVFKNYTTSAFPASAETWLRA